MRERWKAVVGFEGYYEVSDQGRVRSLDRIDGQGRNWPGRMMKPQKHGPAKGVYLHASLCVEGQKTYPLIHRLVLEAFKGPCPADHESAHANGQHADNRFSNLEWKTSKHNAADRVVHGTSGRGEANARAKLTARAVRAIRASSLPQSTLALLHGVKQQAISKIVTRRRWNHL